MFLTTVIDFANFLVLYNACPLTYTKFDHDKWLCLYNLFIEKRMDAKLAMVVRRTKLITLATVDVRGEIYLSAEFGTKFQREIPLFWR